MNLQCRKEPSYAAVVFLFLFAAVDASVPNCMNRFRRCECHEEHSTYYNLGNTSKPLNCIHFDSSSLSWEAANKLCQSQYSRLIYLIDEQVTEAARAKGYSLIWVGIRRIAGFYTNLTSVNPSLLNLRDSNYEWDLGEPLHDCVALSTSSKPNGKLVLVTKPCDSEINFACQNDGFPTYAKSLACPERGYFLYRISTDGPKCTATETIHIDLNVTETVPANQNVSLKAMVVPSFPTAFPSWESSSNSLLTCSMIMGNDTPVDVSNDHSAMIQWFKNGIPIAQHSELFQLGFYADPLKFSTSIMSRQGSYSCGVYLPGFPYMVQSEEVHYFFSDFFTHLLVLHGPKSPVEFNDFSTGTQKIFQKKIEKSMKLLLSRRGKIQSFQNIFHSRLGGSIDWDFQNASAVSDTQVRVTLLLFTQTADRSLFEMVQDRNRMRTYWKDHVEERGGWNIASLEIYLADTCLEERQNNSEIEWIWPETKIVKYAVSEPMCLNGLKLVTRECRPSLIDGAHWVPFDYTECTQNQSRVQDELPTCSDGYRPLKPNHCFLPHLEEVKFTEALDACHSSSSYLMHYNFFTNYSKILDDLDSKTYWISRLPVGAEAEGENVLVIKDTAILSKGLECTSLDLPALKFKSEDCERKLPFLCVKTINTPASSILYSDVWHRFPVDNSISNSSSCFSFHDEMLTWAEAEETCKHSPDSFLLESIQEKEDYRTFRLLMLSLNALSRSSVKEQKDLWWMSLLQENNSFQWLDGSSPSFVDWAPYTNFDITPSAAGVLVKSNDDVQWALAHRNEKKKFICEMKKCKDTRPNRVYLEELLPFSVSSKSSVHLTFRLQCAWSGWFISETVSWYKDGVQLLDSHPYDQLHMDVQIDPKVLTESHLRNFQGYYWCAMRRLDGKVMDSSKVLKRVPGYFTFVVKVVAEFVDTVTRNKCLFIRSNFMRETFRVFDEIVPPDGTLHNVTCNNTHVVYYTYLYANKESLWKDLEAEAKGLTSNPDTLYHEETTAVIKHIEVRSTTKCPEESIHRNGMSITWSSAQIGESCTAQEYYVTESGDEVERQCLGDFYSGAYWAPMPDGHVISTTDATFTLRKLAKTFITEENALNSSQDLEQLTSNPEDLSKEDVRYVAKILRNLATVPVLQPKVLQSVVKTVDSIIESKATGDTIQNIPNKVSSALDDIVSRVPLTPNPLEIAHPHISLSRLPLDSSDGRFHCGGAMSVWNTTLTLLFNRKDLEDRDSLVSILLPEYLVKEVKEKSGNSSSLVIKASHNYYGLNTKSPVIEADFVNYPLRKEPLYPRVEIEFAITEDLPIDEETYQCVFWDHNLNPPGWSYKGCFSKILPNSSRILCSCDHLTAFSLLFDYNKDTTSKEHALALNVITYVGCTLSIIGLVLTMLTFCLFRTFRKRMQLKALFNLSVSLSLFLILFMVGFIKREGGSDVWCLVVGMLLHYLLLATFAWMVVEAYLQYLSLVKVFGTYIPRFIQKAMLFAWGFPLVAVAVVLCVDYTLYFSSDKYCWVATPKAFNYAVATPVLLMLAANFVIFGLILYFNTCGRDSKNLRSNQNQRQVALTRARAIFSVSILLGLSWIFGFLSLISQDLNLLFSYLFALTTTSQGFFIFIFYVFRHHSVRQLWLGLVLPQRYSVDVSRCSTEHLKASHISSRQVLSREERPYVHFNANFS